MKTINLKNLPCLHEFEIYSLEEEDILEISDVPNLSQFRYISLLPKPLPLNMNLLGSVTQLYLGGVFMDNAFFNMIKSVFPFLQSLTLGIGSAVQENLVITSVSIKRLSLRLFINEPFNIQVYAPSLLDCLCVCGKTVPTLSFPSIAPDQVKVTIKSS